MSTLFLVSMGPGGLDLMAPKALAAIQHCSDLVAYGLYLDLLGPVCAGKQHHPLPLGKETDRARLALDLAAGGNNTALISSGDIGIYAMASLVFELLDRELENNPHWLKAEVEVIPGISAMQVGASRAGAVLGHDFCTLSLSDLLTPWETIEKRIHSAGAGDFVIAFYNPVSHRRDWQLNAAREILLNYRPGSTPVVLGRHLSRENETVEITDLQQLRADAVDMFTLVAVGNTETRRIDNAGRQWVYTPRGYRQQ